MDPRSLVLQTFATAQEPPPPADYNLWAEKNIQFGKESFCPGPYRTATVPQLYRILVCLSPDHPCTTVTIRGAAQIFKTTVAQIFIGARMDTDPCDIGYIHPSHDNAQRWARRKWRVMRKQSEALTRLFGEQKSRSEGDTLLYQETKDGRGSLQISGANSPASLSMVTWPAQVQDDLAKWQPNEAGEPEEQSDSRSGAFEWRKILKISTPLFAKTCRITRKFEQGTQEWWHVPCPHEGCGIFQPLTWENFQQNIPRDDPAHAGFTCVSCGAEIEHKHKSSILARGKYVAHNPGAREISIQASRAEMPNYPWADIARKWLEVEGDPSSEQTYLNDWWGLPYTVAAETVPWAEIRNRANGVDAEGKVIEDAPVYDRGRVPHGALIIIIGVDCQGDRIEVHVKGYGESLQRWTIDYEVIPHHIGTDEARAALNTYLKRTWPDVHGNARRVDMLAIDGNAYTKDVYAWAKHISWNDVIVVRGAKGELSPPIALTKSERRDDGKVRPAQKRFYNVGVSGLKISLYEQLKKVDPHARGYCGYPRGLDDEFFRQLTAEKRVIKKDRWGYPRAEWELDHAHNEVLDTEMYAEAAAIRCGWYTRTPEKWAALRLWREKIVEKGQDDLFDPANSPLIVSNAAHPAKPAEKLSKFGKISKMLNG